MHADDTYTFSIEVKPYYNDAASTYYVSYSDASMFVDPPWSITGAGRTVSLPLRTKKSVSNSTVLFWVRNGFNDQATQNAEGQVIITP